MSLADRRGNFAVSTALMLPVLMGLAGGAVDLVVYNNHRSDLQSTVDSAVLAAATEAALKGWGEQAASEVVEAVVMTNLASKFAGGASFDHEVKVDEPSRRVEVDLTQDHFGYFYLGYFTGSPQIRVRAVAVASGQADICVIVQSPTAKDAFTLSGDSSVTASKCSAYSNSVHTSGVTAKGSSKLTTGLSCSGGGYVGGSSNFNPLPLTDCPRIADPLAMRAAAIDASLSTGGCAGKGMTISGKKKSLNPGVYCDGLTITKAATVTLGPGVYVIRDGSLRVDKASSIEGTGVSFVFVGDDAGLELKNESIVSLTAPEDGSTAGILIYARPGSGKKKRDFKIESKNARKLIGTVYVPDDLLVIGGDKDNDGVCDGDVPDDDDDDDDDDEDGEGSPDGEECLSDVGSASSWTAIIARELQITNGVNLVLNADYGGSNVPVPQGLGPTSSSIHLSR